MPSADVLTDADLADLRAHIEGQSTLDARLAVRVIDELLVRRAQDTPSDPAAWLLLNRLDSPASTRDHEAKIRRDERASDEAAMDALTATGTATDLEGGA